MPKKRIETITAVDGHGLTLHIAEPDQPAKAALVICQEIFGVNGHIKAVVESYAAEGFVAVAPALFDRIGPDIELGYDPDGIARGRELRQQVPWETAMRDVAAAVDWCRATTRNGPIGVIGYCWGGSLAWLAAADLKPAAAVCYYGGQIAQFSDRTPTCPVQMHFGEHDAHIPEADRSAILAAQPSVELHVYDAGHGFNCTERDDFVPDAAKLARERTLEFLNRHLL
ncbi:dienelactone hydrolase family protein [Fodinicurvata sp. EGI_FJ10296]|uniref:dienelactone hydrolase family protein n=1 Tax=Fodinicurvata sp. EGI_FJ10296 TaxID=3231908 RepID=UPI003452D8E2